MSDGGNGATRLTRLEGHVRRVGDEATALADGLEDAAGEIAGFVREQAEARPYATLAAAGGLGYVLGGGLPLGLVRACLAVGGRIAVSRLVHLLVTGGPERRTEGPIDGQGTTA